MISYEFHRLGFISSLVDNINLITMKRNLFFLLLLCLTSIGASGQSVKVNEDFTITRMLTRMAEINKSGTGVDGWRIQILATTDRRKMEAAKTMFQRNYPQVSIDWIHEKPYYKLRAGAFASKLDAAKLLYNLKKDYTSAYPAKDNNINPQELLGL